MITTLYDLKGKREKMSEQIFNEVYLLAKQKLGEDTDFKPFVIRYNIVEIKGKDEGYL